MDFDLPRPNNQALSWFYGEHKKGDLVLNPKYQRNPIWSLGQKCFLIDSLISGYPLPQVYINVKTKGIGDKRTTKYEVVDGQQRLTSILEYMNDKWALVATTAKSYPVSSEYPPLIGCRYSELPSELQDRIWNYPLVVQELRGWSDPRIGDLFRRLNYVVEKLNKQELRHSQYFGEFLATVERLADLEFWDSISLFTRKDSARMKDIEFISELFVIVIDGVQDQQKTLDDFYAEYDVSFKNKNKYLRIFDNVISSLETISNLVRDTRLKKKADFYGLFAAVTSLVKEQGSAIELHPYSAKLRKLDSELNKEPERMSRIYSEYQSTVIEGPNKLAKRKRRMEIFLDLLS